MAARFFAAFVSAFVFAVAPAAAAAPAERAHLEDFDAMWRAIDAAYAYGERGAWRKARERWRPKARAARTRAELVLALEGAIAHLRDDGVTLSEQVAGSARVVPAESDIWARWQESVAVVTAVRTFSSADVAGLQPGHVVTHVDGIPVERAARERLRPLGASDGAAMDWALRHLLAGPRSGTLRLGVRDGREARTLEIERAANPPSNGLPLIARRMGEEKRDLGYIRIKNVLTDPRFPDQFDGALNYLKDTRALILDLRETADGGARSVVEKILARFVQAQTPWQAREVPGKGRVTDLIAPRAGAAPYRGRVVVLVDRWTAGEAEALAAGLEAAANATLVGTPMAGLRGDPREVTLPHSGITVRFPAQRSFHVNGTPREALRPAVEVDLAAPSGGPGDPILYQALKLLSPSSSPAPGNRSAPR